MVRNFGKIAKWIWLDHDDTPNRYVEFSVRFTPAHQSRVQFLISVEGQYALFINGYHLASTQYSDYPFAKAVQAPDIMPFLQEGENLALMQCWYQGEDTSVCRHEIPGLCFEIWQGDVLLAASDEHTAVRLMTEYLQGETYSFTRQMGFGFSMVFAPPSPWSEAVCISKTVTFVDRPIQELQLEECIAARLISQGTFVMQNDPDIGESMQRAGLFWKPAAEMAVPGALDTGLHYEEEQGNGIFLVYDLGKMYEGYLSLDVVCPCATYADVGFGEHVQDLRVRTSVGGRCFAARIAVGATQNLFVHWFRRLGCRYLQLFIHSHEAIVFQVGIVPAFYPVKEGLGIIPSDMLHRKIAEVSRDTLLACMHEHYEDCPWREQALYAFDSRNQMLAGYYAFGEFDFARENIRLLAQSQREDGLLELCAPARIPITIPSFSLFFVVAFEEYMRYSGDIEFGHEMLPIAQRILDAFYSHVDGNLVWRFEGVEYWNFYEWRKLLDGEEAVESNSAEAGLQLILLLALQRMKAIRNMLGLPPCAVEQHTAYRLTQGLETFWNEEEQAYASFIRSGRQMQYSELIQALALYTGSCPKKRREQLRRKLLEERLVPITLSYSLFKYEALLQDPLLAQVVFDEVATRWGKMLFSGATTFWEMDEGSQAFNRAGSLCHGWSAIPLYLYGAYGLGVQPIKPGKWARLKTLPLNFTFDGELHPPEKKDRQGASGRDRHQAR